VPKNEFTRKDGRSPMEIRKVTLERNCNIHAEGSTLVSFGDTRVICTASVEEKVPPFLRGAGSGWVTAEYAMLPRATGTRTQRESTRGRISGRSHEIQRLIGRSLRAAVDLGSLGERTVWIDCDVLQADGGTRTAAITGGFVALADALRKLWKDDMTDRIPLLSFVAAISAGRVDGDLVLDLSYAEDSSAEVDSNFVMTDGGSFIEVQGTGEGGVFSRTEMDALLDMATTGIMELIDMQRAALQLTGDEQDAIAKTQDSFRKR